MKYICVVVLSIWIFSCTQDRPDVSPGLEDTYRLVNLQSREILGTVEFNANKGYVYTSTVQFTDERGPVNVVIKTIGTWYNQADLLILQDQIYQSITAFDRWGNGMKMQPAHINDCRNEVPVPNCRKVILVGTDLMLL